MSARPGTQKRPRALSPTTTLNVMNSNSNSGMNSNSNAGITSPPVKRAKTIRKANTQPTPIPLRTAAVGAANNIRMKAKANANNIKFLAAKSPARLRSVNAPNGNRLKKFIPPVFRKTDKNPASLRGKLGKPPRSKKAGAVLPALLKLAKDPMGKTPPPPGQKRVLVNAIKRKAASKRIPVSANSPKPNNTTTNVSSVPRVNNQSKTVRRSTRVKSVKEKPPTQTVPTKTPKSSVRGKTPKSSVRGKTPKSSIRGKTATVKFNTSPRVNSGPKSKIEMDMERVSKLLSNDPTFQKGGTIPMGRTDPTKNPNKGYSVALYKIIQAIDLPEKHADLKDFLIYIYIQKSTNELTKKLFGGKQIKEAVRIIWNHCLFFQKRSRGTDNLTLNIEMNKTKYTEFAYLMYLDMKHDETISDISFSDFIQSNIIRTFFGSAYKNIDKNIKSDILNKLTNLPKKNFESTMKQNFSAIFDTGKSIDMMNKDVNAEMFNLYGKNPKEICLLFDQEDDGITLSNASRRVGYSYVYDKVQRISKSAMNEPGNTIKTKPFYNTVTIANLVDPGHDMQVDSAKKDASFFMKKDNPTTTLSWNYRKPVFKIGGTTLKYRLDAVSYKYVIDISNDRVTKTIPGGITGPAARKSNATTDDKISKFLGDFMQILTTVALTKNNPVNKGHYRYVLGTGDAMCGAIHSYICDITKTKNRLWFVMSKEQRSKLYGMEDMINLNAIGNNIVQPRSRTTGFF